MVEGDLLEPDTLAPAFEGVDAVYYLVHSLGVGEDFAARERSARRTPLDVVTYADMMQAYARAAGLMRRLIVPVPVLTPRLSAHWVDLVTAYRPTCRPRWSRASRTTSSSATAASTG